MTKGGGSAVCEFEEDGSIEFNWLPLEAFLGLTQAVKDSVKDAITVDQVHET